MYVKIICSSVSDITNFEIKRKLNAVFLHNRKFMTKKYKCPNNKKKAFEMKEKKALLLYKHRLQEFPNA